MTDSMSLAIIGAGCIGRRVAKSVADGMLPYIITAICDVDSEAASGLQADFAPQARILDLEHALASAEVVVEAAAGSVVPQLVAHARVVHATSSLPKHILVMSVGGLQDVEDLDAPGPVVHVPSGALGGLDAVQALAVAGLDEVVLTTRKPPAALGLDELAAEQVLFEGSAAEVIKLYPKNVNVAIALSLAGIGAERTRVRLVADPQAKRNTHHVLARGTAGEIEFTSRNEPFPDNPRTSYLAALSAIASLARLAAHLQVG
jgi:aspartate dehydrogenase